MTLSVFLIVLLAAFAHASWNAIVKSGADKLMTMALVAGTGSVLAALCLPFLPAPAPASWPYLAVSAVLQNVYFLLLTQAYRHADMSRTYPLMRGTAPLLVAGFGALVLGEHLPAAAWLGIGVLSMGILATVRIGGEDGRGAAWALANAGVIATYTLSDGIGVRLSGAAAGYTLWVFLLGGLPISGWMLLRRGDTYLRYLARNWRAGLIGGIGSIVSYGLALWAMTQAPVAVVAALRETAILFGLGIAVVMLGERPTAARIAGAMTIALGAVMLRLA